MQVAIADGYRFTADNSQFGIPDARIRIAYAIEASKMSGLAGGTIWARHHVQGMRIDARKRCASGW